MRNRVNFTEQVQGIHKSLGGKATRQELAQAVFNKIDEDTYRDVTWSGFADLVCRAARAADRGGLSASACISGTYVQRTLWSDSEYRFVIRDHMKRAKGEQRLAWRYASECRARTGIWIDPATVLGEGLA